jgi:threonine/homoserine/homoserine lactone efflux protein
MSFVDAPQFAVFLGAALILAITPGPGMAYVVARTAAGGRREGLASCAGTALGGMGHVLAAAWGLSALLAQSAMALGVVKYLGAAYLIYLGIRTLMDKPSDGTAPRLAAIGCYRAFGEGAVVELLNVKTALFFLAFIPQFVDPAAPPAGQFVLMGSLCVAFNTAVDVLAVLGTARVLSGSATRRLRARMLRAGSGLTLLTLGVYVALARQQR